MMAHCMDALLELLGSPAYFLLCETGYPCCILGKTHINISVIAEDFSFLVIKFAGLKKKIFFYNILCIELDG